MDHVFAKYSTLAKHCPTRDGALVAVDDCVQCCSKSHWGGIKSYDCGNYRSVYVVKYLATQVVHLSRPILDHLTGLVRGGAGVSVAALGGGPGTEALALMDVVQSRGLLGVKLVVDTYDRESSWRPVFRDLTSRFSRMAGTVELRAQFLETDILHQRFPSSSVYDMVFVSWVLSEVDRQNRGEVVRLAGKLAKPARYLLVADRREPALMANISDVLETVGDLKLIANGEVTDNCQIEFPDWVKETFQVRINCGSAYWIAKKR
jgi:hypothetical protein